MKVNLWVVMLCLFGVSLSAAAAEKGLVLHYDFAEARGPALHDRSGNGIQGAIHGAEWVKQPDQHALRFDGVDDYVDCGAPPSLNLTTAVTLEAWVYPEAVPTGEPRLMGREMRSYSMTYYKDADLWFYVNGQTRCGADLPPGYWHHVVGTFDGGVVRLYIDGRQVGESPSEQTTINKPKDNFFIGGKRDAKSGFQGMIREVRVYGRALSRDEVWQRYRESSPFAQVEIKPYLLPSGREVAVELDFRGLGELPRGASAEVSLRKAGDTKAIAAAKFANAHSWGRGEVILNVPKLTPGAYEVSAQVADAGGQRIGKRAVERLMVPARRSATPTKVGKRLNNLVTELLNVKDLSAQKRNRFSFTNPRKGWVFISTTATLEDGANLWVLLDAAGKDNYLQRYTKPRNKPRESMRFLPAGEHGLTIQTEGNAALDTLIVRAIPQIIHCTFDGNWDFLEHDVLDNVNVMAGSGEYSRYERIVERWKSRGKKWIAGCSGLAYFRNWDAEKSYKYWAGQPGFSHPRLDGIIVDEFGSKPLDHYPASVESIRRLHRNEAFKDKQFIPYICRVHKAFVKPMIELGYPYAWEHYLREMATRADGLRFLKTHFADTTASLEEQMPGFARNLIVCFGYLSRPPQSLDCNPSVNFLVWMDMQFSVLANHPAFDGVFGVMEYLTGYADEEALRWAGRLYRHYCIEGKRARLSTDPYLLSHIRNPDFEEGARGWTVSPAAPRSIAVKSDYSLGYLQGRYYYKIGNSFLWTKRSVARPNVFSQEITDLQPGRQYSLKMFTADYGDYTTDKPVQEGPHAVSIRFQNVDILAEKCFQRGYLNIHKRLGRDAPQHKVRFNYHRQVFRAKGKTARVTISDWADQKDPGGPAGQELMFNFIEVQPYLADSQPAVVPAPAPTPRQIGPPQKELAAHYTFDEGSGPLAYDMSGSGNHGKIHGAKYAGMKKGSALRFDGIRSSVDCGKRPGLNMGTGPFSVELWFKMEKPLRAVFVGKQGGAWESRGWRLSYGDHGKTVEFHFADGKKYEWVACGLDDKSWHHLVAVRKDRTAYLYMDGTLRAKKAADIFGTDVSCEDAMMIGSLPGWHTFAGVMDEVTIHRRALTQKQITARCAALKTKMAIVTGNEEAEE